MNKKHISKIVYNGDTLYVKDIEAREQLENAAMLDESGKIPSTILPSYVDDVVEYNGTASFPATGESGKIYIDTTTNLSYRWSGSQYIEISSLLTIGETTGTAFDGKRGKDLEDDFDTYADSFDAHEDNADIHVTLSEKTTWNNKTSNVGTITGINMNGSSKGTSGIVDLGTVITAHQDISGKADKTNTVSNITYNSTTQKLQKTINGTTSDVVTIISGGFQITMNETTGIDSFVAIGGASITYSTSTGIDSFVF